MGKENNSNDNNSGGGDGDNNLMGLFAPPPPRQSGETDALLQSIVSVSADNNNHDDIKLTIREDEVENLTTPLCYGSSTTSRHNDEDAADVVGDQDFFLKTHDVSSVAGVPYKNTNKNISFLFASSSSSAFPSSKTTQTTTPSFLRTISSYLMPYTSVSTWLGGIMFVLYHVVFCMANGGSITRPYSDISMIGDMARYTAVGIMVSCPFLIYRLSDRHNIIGIPAMFPSTDLFLAPFMAEAASVIDKCITDDINSGTLLINNNDNPDDDESLIITRLWFGSFAVVISFGMMLSGFLLIVASKNKLANLGTFLPYGVLCGFFSAVGILMWMLAITIDTPASTTTTADSSDDDRYIDWIIITIHHIPSLIVGIAMNRLGPKHPFFVTGLIIATLIVFYLLLYFLPGLSLEDWFYSHDELQSSMSSSTTTLLASSSATSTSTTTPTLLLPYLPPNPLGTWFAIWEQYVYWKAVLLGAEQMIALAILYLLRASIHATALKKNTLNLVRRVPIAVTTKGKAEEGGNSRNNDDDFFDDSADLMVGHHRRKSSTSSSSSSTMTQKAYDGANQLAKTVRDGVEIVNLSLTDKQALKGKRYGSPIRRNRRQRKCSTASTASTATAVVTNINTTTGNINDDNGRILDLLSHRSNSSTTTKSFFNEERNNPAIIASSGDDDKTTVTRDDIIDYVEIRPSHSDLTVEEIFIEYGFGFFITAICGGVGCCPTIATSNTMYAVGAGSAAPQYLSIFLLLVVFYCSGFEIVQFIPKTVFSSLLVLSAADNIVTWFIKPLSKMDTLLEWSVVPVIMLCSVLIGMLPAIVLGIAVSTFIFVAAFFRVGVVKYDASGLEIRSRIERSLVQSVWLDAHGDDIRVIVLQNYLFFGNATSILRYVETMFEEISLNESIRLDFPIPPVPKILVLDLSLITGMDTSSVDVFMDIWRMCKTNDCKLYVCGLSPRLKKTFARGGMIPDTKGPKKSRSLLYMSDLDHGLGKAEDILIHLKMGEFAIQSLFHLEKKGASGFHVALQKIDRLHGLEMSKGLLGLEPYTRLVTLSEGQILFEKDGGVISEEDHGLFFIEVGMIRVEDDSSGRTNTRTGGSTRWNNSLGSNFNTLKGKHARLDAAARQAALGKSVGGMAISQSNSMRVATAGPGWVIGTHEFATGQHSPHKFKATTKVKMHHIRFDDLRKVEEENPILVLRLYKILAHVMARKEEDTVAHLSTLHNILSSPAHSKPIRRSRA